MKDNGASEAVWVRWCGNNSKLYDGKINGMHRDCFLSDLSTRSIGDSVEIVWGKSSKIWYGVLIDTDEPKPQKMPETIQGKCTAYVHTYNLLAPLIFYTKTTAPISKYPINVWDHDSRYIKVSHMGNYCI